MRAQMRINRQHAKHENNNSANQLRDVFLLHVKPQQGAIIAGYIPFRDEINIIPLLYALRGLGHTIALPVVQAPHSPLLFRRWDGDTALAPNAMGIAEPAATAAESVPDLVLLPLLAFDRQRYRLGYGVGYYDRTLCALRQAKPIQAIGVGFSFQQVDHVPVEAHDVRLDHVVTELNYF